MPDSTTILHLIKTLEKWAKTSTHKLQSAALIYDTKKKAILFLENNQYSDAAVAVITQLPFWKTFFWSENILVTLHTPSPEAVECASGYNIRRIYFKEHLHSAESLRLLRKYHIPCERIFC